MLPYSDDRRVYTFEYCVSSRAMEGGAIQIFIACLLSSNFLVTTEKLSGFRRDRTVFVDHEKEDGDVYAIEASHRRF
ncbi:hypothetical protein KDAU_05280 [Dictyobacter aurantiacus]|uniref:Uncharacterized protein n=1 Tax=Dictyobacter aurantiacus TaxID=1936993 RepID=A0A401Z8P0_9CHLR|nr:hypothetical protein KDAU_05280 [Dictyobacter aurantiacus]